MTRQFERERKIKARQASKCTSLRPNAVRRQHLHPLSSPGTPGHFSPGDFCHLGDVCDIPPTHARGSPDAHSSSVIAATNVATDNPGSEGFDMQISHPSAQESAGTAHAPSDPPHFLPVFGARMLAGWFQVAAQPLTVGFVWNASTVPSAHPAPLVGGGAGGGAGGDGGEGGGGFGDAGGGGGNAGCGGSGPSARGTWLPHLVCGRPEGLGAAPTCHVKPPPSVKTSGSAPWNLYADSRS